MTTLVYGLEEPIGRYLARQFPEFGPNYVPHKAIGWADADRKLIAALAIDYEHPWDGRVALYAERPDFWTPKQLRTLFGQAFGEWGLTRLTLWIGKRNKRARRLAEGLGFRLEGTKRGGFDGLTDEMMYGMTKHDCRWFKENRHGEAKAA